MLSAQFYSRRQNESNIELAEKLVQTKEKFDLEEKFKEALSAITVFVLRSKEFARTDAVIEALGLPCDPVVCLT